MLRDKRGFIPLFAIICVLLAPAPLLAEEPSEADTAAMMAAGQPGDHHQHLAVMEGSWDVAGRFWMPGAPAPMEAEGAATITRVLGGRYLHQDYTTNLMGMDFKGFGTIGYDNFSKQYQATWTDNMTTGILFDTGQCDGTGKKTVFHGEMPDAATGSVLPTRTEYIVESNDKFIMAMYNVNSDGTDFKMMELVYTRK